MLLVGGKSDGKRIEVDVHALSGGLYRVPVSQKPSAVMCNINDLPPITETIDYEIYEVQAVCGNSQEWSVLVHKGMTGDELMRRLIKGYKEADPPREIHEE